METTNKPTTTSTHVDTSKQAEVKTSATVASVTQEEKKPSIGTELYKKGFKKGYAIGNDPEKVVAQLQNLNATRSYDAGIKKGMEARLNTIEQAKRKAAEKEIMDNLRENLRQQGYIDGQTIARKHPEHARKTIEEMKHPRSAYDNGYVSGYNSVAREKKAEKEQAQKAGLAKVRTTRNDRDITRER